MTLKIKDPLSSNWIQYQIQLILDDIPRKEWDAILSRSEELISQYEKDMLLDDDIFTGISIGVFYLVVYNKRDLVYAENIMGVIVNEFINV